MNTFGSMSAQPLPRCEFEGKNLLLKLDVVLQGETSAIGPVVKAIMQMVEEMKCAAGKEFEIETALREALANAIKYGCRNDPQRTVECSVLCDESRGMLIVVRDPGPGFDPASIPSPIVGQNVFSDHGRGIYLISQLMDEVRFEKGGTEIHMRKA
jgi:serine/threonine-protein kinase RsbW